MSSVGSRALKRSLYVCCSETVIVPLLKSFARKRIVETEDTSVCNSELLSVEIAIVL
jgi:hypothetical protein